MNNNRAVMSERKSSKAELDIFPTPPWATRALCEWIGRQRILFGYVLEPAAGYGHMAKPLRALLEEIGEAIIDKAKVSIDETGSE